MAMNMLVKVKGKINDINEIKQKVEGISKFQGEEKLEVYNFSKKPVDFDNVLSEDKFRVYKKNDIYVVKFRKTHESHDGINIATEQEFTITDFEDFKELMENLGIIIYVEEIRTSDVYVENENSNILIKITNVEGLGDFVEVQSKCLTDDDQRFALAKIKKVLNDLGVFDTDERFYFEMLLEKAKEDNQ